MRQTIQFLFLLITILMLISQFFPASVTKTLAATSALNSANLSLQLSTDPYSYKVIERSTSAVLVSQNLTSFKVGSGAFTTTSATSVKISNTTLDADLKLSGTSGTAHIKFAFITPQVLQVLLTFNGDAPSQVTEQFNDQQEQYYGIWEYPFDNKLDNRGIKNDYLGIGRKDGTNFCSGRAPFYMSSKKYGIYAETQAQGQYTVAVNGKTSFSFNQPQLKYDIIYGPGYYEMLARYTTIAGGAYMPPLWAFDSIWWKDDDHKDLRDADNAQEGVLDTANQLQKHRIPASAIWIDRPYGTGTQGWGNMDFDESFPDPKKMVSDLKARGLNLMLWIANRLYNDLVEEAKDNDYLFDTTEKGPAADMRKPEAYEWLKKKLDTFVQLGVKGYKIDRGEEGEQPDSVENENMVLVTKLAYEGLTAVHSNDAFVFARNVADTGRKYAALWNGDTDSDFTGLSYSVTSGLRSGAINFPMWGSDTGGYTRSDNKPTEELFARWMEFSAYSPILEVLIGRGYTPWYDSGSELIEITRKQASIHHDLIPYTRSFMYIATKTGAPIMRPLVFSYPSDSKVATMADEYLYGSEILVAPVITSGAKSRSVYLPVGNWLDYNDKSTIHSGGKTITANAPLDTIPVFVKEGAIIPRGDILKSNNTWTPNWSPSLRIELFPSNKQTSSFYYYTGSTVQGITSRNSNGNMIIQLGNLGVGGNLNIYVKSFKSVVRNNSTLVSGKDYTYDANTHLLTLPFSGPTALVLNGASSIFN